MQDCIAEQAALEPTGMYSRRPPPGKGGQHSRSADMLPLGEIQPIQLTFGFHRREACEPLPAMRTFCRQDGDKSAGLPIWTP